MRYADDLALDDADDLAAADPGDLLRATADSGAQVRRALAATDAATLRQVAADGRPRSVVVAGSGTAGTVGDLLAAVCGTGCPVAVSTLRGRTLPGWVGPLDLVIAVSGTGRTEETIAVAAEAVKRGSRLVGVGPAGSPLHALVVSSPGAVFVSVDPGVRSPRALLWLLATPLLLVADALGLASVPREVLEQAADVLDARSVECGPASALAENPAKLLGVSLAISLPMVWGTSAVSEVAAQRLACRLHEDAGLPVVSGALPEVLHHQAAVLDSVFSRPSDDDIFRDPVEEGAAPATLRLVLLRDAVEHPQDARRADLAREAAERRDIPVDVVRAPDGHVVVRLAWLTGTLDWAAVYSAIALGVDPSASGDDIRMLGEPGPATGPIPEDAP